MVVGLPGKCPMVRSDGRKMLIILMMILFHQTSSSRWNTKSWEYCLLWWAKGWPNSIPSSLGTCGDRRQLQYPWQYMFCYLSTCRLWRGCFNQVGGWGTMLCVSRWSYLYVVVLYVFFGNVTLKDLVKMMNPCWISFRWVSSTTI